MGNNKPKSKRAVLTPQKIDDHTRTVIEGINGQELGYVQHLFHELGQDGMKKIVNNTLDGTLPLLEAALIGIPWMVHALIKTYHADLEGKGIYEFSRGTRHSVTALWGAAVEGERKTLKALISHKADINAMSDTGYTPVLMACKYEEVDTVTLLVEKGADVNIPGPKGISCLMVSVCSTALCQLLLRKKVDVNSQDDSGKTALHYAIAHGAIDTIRLLLKRGADPNIRNSYGNCAMRDAALRFRLDILELMYTTQKITKLDFIEGFRLIASSYALYKQEYAEALKTLVMAIHQEDSPHIQVRKPVLSHKRELCTQAELRAIANNPVAISEQAYLVRARVLGPMHPNTLYGMVALGEMYDQQELFEPALDMWTFALKSLQEQEAPLTSHFLKLLELLHKLLHHKDESMAGILQFEKMEQFLKMMTSATMSPDNQAHREDSLAMVLHIIHYMSAMARSDDQDFNFRRSIYHLNKSICLPDGRSLLHLAADKDTSKFDPPLFPSVPVMAMLLECGSDVNERDCEGNTALHVATPLSCAINIPIQEQNRALPIARYLVKKGAYPDAMNHKGVVVSKYLKELWPALPVNLSLKTLAARVIRKHISLNEEHFPTPMLSFIEMK